MTRDYIAEWKDLLSGLNLIRLGPSGAIDDLAIRSIAAIEAEDEEYMEHLSALVMGQLMAKGKKIPDFANATWGRLSRDFHSNRCMDDGCVERRNYERLKALPRPQAL